MRSMSSEAGSIGIMPTRAPRVGSRKRLRLTRRVEPACSVEDERPDPVAILRAPGEHMLRFHPLDPQPIRAVANRVADLRDVGTREGRDRRCACRGRAGSRSSRTCRRRRAATAPSGRSRARQPRPERQCRLPGSRLRRRPREGRRRETGRRLPDLSLPRSGSDFGASGRRARRPLLRLKRFSGRAGLAFPESNPSDLERESSSSSTRHPASARAAERRGRGEACAASVGRGHSDESACQ